MHFVTSNNHLTLLQRIKSFPILVLCVNVISNVFFSHASYMYNMSIEKIKFEKTKFELSYDRILI